MFSFFSNNNASLVNTQRIPLGNSARIAVSYISESLFIYDTEGDDIVIKEYLTESDPDCFAKITADDQGILIKHGERRMFSMMRGYIEVYLPQSFFGHLHLKTVSGKIEALNRLTLSEITVANTSGRIRLGKVMTGTAVLSSVSGTIEVEGLQAEADIHTTSGSIRIGSAEGDGDFRTVSGTVDVAFLSVTGDITASSTSGRVRLAIPPLLSFNIKAHSISGSVSVPFGGELEKGRHAVQGTVGMSPQVNIDLSTVSGRVEIIPV